MHDPGDCLWGMSCLWMNVIGIMCYGGKTKDLEPLVLQCLQYRGKRYGLCLQRVKGLDEKTGHIWTVKGCVRTQCVCWMCPEGWYLHMPDCLWDWVLREGGLSSVLRGLSSSQGAFLTRCCLSLLSGMMSAWLAWSAKTPVLLFESESEVVQLCLTLSDLMGCSLPGFSVHGIFQAGILEWVAISFSSGIFLTQGSNPDLPHCRQTLDCLSRQGGYYSLRSPCNHTVINSLWIILV